MTASAPSSLIMTSTSPTSAPLILQHMGVPGERGLYVLGSFEGRVTIYSQQIRALNLIHALVSTGALNSESRVAIVGGGIGGMTAAVGAAHRGASVTIFERRAQILHLMRGCHTRWVHPNIYDWPYDSSLRNTTELPFLNWSAGSAGEVAGKLLAEWETLKDRLGIREEKAAEVTLRPMESGRRRLVATSPKFRNDEFDIIVLAVGFGNERTIPPQPLRSYWRDDSLHQPEIGGTATPTHYFVSGNGDGGLIDLLRIRFQEFRHDLLLNELVTAADIDGLRDPLHQIELEAWNLYARGADPGEYLARMYRELRGTGAVDDRIQKRLRRDTRATFNFVEWPFTIFSSVLSRFLVSRLLEVDPQVHVILGRCVAVDGQEPNLVVKLTDGMGTRELNCQRAVLRHGPVSALEAEFPELYKRMEPILRARNALDQTRVPCWPDGFFDLMPPMNAPLPQPSAGGPESGVPEGEPPPSSSHPSPPPASGAPSTDVFHVPGHTMLEQLGPPVHLAESGSAPVQNRVSVEARKLRDEVLTGRVTALDLKLDALTDSDRRFLVRSVAIRALEQDEEALRAFGLLLEQERSLEREVLHRALMEIVRKAAFSSSIETKVRVLEYPVTALKQVEVQTLTLFFEDVFQIIDRDHFGEVNTLVPKLVIAQEAVPEALYVRYFTTLLDQSRSSSFQGAPAAKHGLMQMPNRMVKAAIESLDEELLMRHSTWDVLKEFVTKNIELADDTKKPLLKNFVGLRYREFLQKHSTEF